VVVVPATVLRFARPGVPRALAGEEVAQ